MGAISQIFSILNEVSTGYHFMEIGLILRESILLSKMLLSAESWHKLFLYQIEKFEQIDKIFLRKLFNCHSKTSIEFLYSESESIPLRFVTSVRRLLYWWHILSVDKSEMIFKVYSAQKLSPVSGDWINMLESDKTQFKIKLSDKEVDSISKQKFKKYVQHKAVELTSEFLEEMKKKNSKSKQLDVWDMKISSYLVDSRFNKEERELLFKLK